jgi:hypothetical protein
MQSAQTQTDLDDAGEVLKLFLQDFEFNVFNLNPT